jgi:hypothetical protein
MKELAMINFLADFNAVNEAFENVKKREDDFGHLRFGRSERRTKSAAESHSLWNARTKYNDPGIDHNYS